MSIVEYHRTTDPACVYFVQPYGWVQRRRFERGRGIPCPTCFPAPSSPRPLMKWRAPRLTRATHRALAGLVGVVLTFAGVVIIGTLVADDLAALVFGILCGVLIGTGLTIYDAEVIDR